MFSQGQLIFAVSALVVFILVLTLSYKGDKKQNKTYFKNSYIVLIAFLLFTAFLFVLKLYFRGR